MPHYEPIIGVHDYKLVSSKEHYGPIELTVEYVGELKCIFCLSPHLRKKDSFIRRLKHTSCGIKPTYIIIKSHKFYCRSCHRYFNQRLPGITPRYRTTMAFRDEVAMSHHYGFSKARSSDVHGVSSSTVERCYQGYLQRKNQHRSHGFCPKVMGIDEKFFTRKKGYMTTICDLKRHKVYDLVLGRSEKSIGSYLEALPGKHNCRVVVMDLSETYRSLIREHLKHAMIVADRFHVIRLINHHFLKTWALLDEVGRRNRGLLSLMRRHYENLSPEQIIKLRKYLKSNPALEIIYDFKQELCRIMKQRVYSKSQARKLIPIFIDLLKQLKSCGFKPLVTLGETLESWQEEIVRMWRFSKTNSITEGFHNKMEEILRRAYGMRNFENFKLRVKEYCS